MYEKNGFVMLLNYVNSTTVGELGGLVYEFSNFQQPVQLSYLQLNVYLQVQAMFVNLFL
jgi:hypothetical protein